MELISAQQMMDEACALLEGKTRSGTPHEQDAVKAEAMMHEILNANIGNVTVLYTLGSLYLKTRREGMAIELLAHIVQAAPEMGEAWNNLGLAYTEIRDFEKAGKCCERAFELIQHPDISCNLAAMHLNRGAPKIALDWCEKGLALDAGHKKSLYHKGMAYLELGRWAEGWDLSEIRLEPEAASHNIAVRNYHGHDGMTPWWDGRTAGHVVIHGEQGMGDEIMFGTCLRDAVATGADIILECSPRLAKLFDRSFGGDLLVHGTNEIDGHEWLEEGHDRPDFKCAIGSLPKFYRRRREDFPGTPYLKADPKHPALDAIKALGPRLKIGLAWQGGVHDTGADLRSFHPRMLHPLFRHDVDFISLQYDPTAQGNIADVEREFGETIHHWPQWVEMAAPQGGASDIDDLAAVISGLDLVITVPQTAYHVAGALGIPTLVLVQSTPDWRLLTQGNEPWYDSVDLIRMEHGSRNWVPVISEADVRLGRFVSELPAASAVAS